MLIRSAFITLLIFCSIPARALATTTVVSLQPPRTAMHTSVVSLSPPEPAATVGNDVFRHLPTLFVLDALFQNESDGLLTPGPATLQNILLLYRLFFSHNPFAQP